VLAGLRGFQDHFKKEAVEACERAQAESGRTWEAEERALLAGARVILEQPPLERTTKTDLVGLIESLIQSRVDLALVLTDGIDTAHDGLPPLALPQGTRVVLLLVPARSEDGGAKGTHRAAAQWRAAGVASVPYPVLVAPGGWARLAASEEARP
jgi:hypothetical protein